MGGWASTRSHSVPLFFKEKAEQEPQRAQCPASVHWCQESRAVQRCVNSIAASGTAPAQKLCQWVVSRLSFPRAGLSDVRKQQAVLPSQAVPPRAAAHDGLGAASLRLAVRRVVMEGTQARAFHRVAVGGKQPQRENRCARQPGGTASPKRSKHLKAASPQIFLLSSCSTVLPSFGRVCER